jgi:outer membrane receptor protein involved in Fe transport
MKIRFTRFNLLFVLILALGSAAQAQVQLRGNVSDDTGETLIGASVVVSGTSIGNTTDFDGNFELEVPSVPTVLVISYVGYASDTFQVENSNDPINIILGDNATDIATVVVKGRRISEKRQQSALTLETLDNIAIKETPAANFYDGLGALKDVDLTAASIGFKIINTRGFNSTNPVRSLQLIDGVDNQSPGLNFSLGNFLGASDLDVNSVNIIVGASSAFYGPNAFNGVISLQTKDPFLQQGLSATVKTGERQLREGGFRWAEAIKNKNDKEFFAYKINAYGFSANDWEATNFDPITDSEVGPNNLGGFDAVNIYGDEQSADRSDLIGLGTYFRDGYREEDLVDYDSRNLKLNGTVHFRLKPDEGILSPEIIASSSYSRGTTIFQGENRFSLRGIQFFQHKLELRKRNTYFLRAYLTHENAGDSFDPFFTALRLNDSTRQSGTFFTAYSDLWNTRIIPRVNSSFGRDNVPQLFDFPNQNGPGFDVVALRAAQEQFVNANQDSFRLYHALVREDIANNALNTGGVNEPFVPGTPRFDSAFNSFTQRLTTNGGTRFFDQSALYHINGEHMFNNLVSEDRITDLDLRVGASFRNYLPNSQGTILSDTLNSATGESVNIDTYEFGLYGGGTVTIDGQLKASVSLRLDKNENFDYLFSPAASLVWNPNEETTLRASFSGAIRNPTLADQYLFYNVGPAILIGNLNGFDSLITIESFQNRLNSGVADTLEFFDVAPIRPEKVRTFEVGVRTTLFEKLFLDATYYYSFYEDFIGFNLGLTSGFVTGRPINTQVFRVSANAADRVTTQGFSIGGNYYFGEFYAISGNYSFNILNTTTDDPIIPAYNTPEHKFNIGIAARDIPLGSTDMVWGFNTNYKWVEGFTFEGSPQFTGFIPSYGLLDAQVNVTVPKINSTIKIGASNLLDNRIFQTYGGPTIGRLAYASILYEFRKN